MADSVPFGSMTWFVMLGLLVFSRGMDFLSTWVATPNLVLEGNPLAKWLGWKRGLLLNLALCLGLAFLPMAAVILATTSVLVAARNFQSAWLMRSMGEAAYRDWFLTRLGAARLPLFLVCLFGQTALTAVVGGALIGYAWEPLAQAIGVGIVGYAVAVALYTLLSVWRMRRSLR